MRSWKWLRLEGSSVLQSPNGKMKEGPMTSKEQRDKLPKEAYQISPQGVLVEAKDLIEAKEMY